MIQEGKRDQTLQQRQEAWLDGIEKFLLDLSILSYLETLTRLWKVNWINTLKI